MMSASQAIFRTVEALTGPVKSRFPVCSVVAPGLEGTAYGALHVPVRPVVSEPGEEVAVVDGDHDLRAESSGGGQRAGGEGDFAGADEAVEEFLRARTQVQRDVHVRPPSPRRRRPALPVRGVRCAPVAACRPGALGAGCGGWWRCS